LIQEVRLETDSFMIQSENRSKTSQGEVEKLPHVQCNGCLSMLLVSMDATASGTLPIIIVAYLRLAQTRWIFNQSSYLDPYPLASEKIGDLQTYLVAGWDACMLSR
jgi:hypothetical protein